MLLAIDVGNTDTKFGLHDGASWLAVWRRPTHDEVSGHEIAHWLQRNIESLETTNEVGEVLCASVVPGTNQRISDLSLALTGREPFFLLSSEQVGLKVDYSPPTGVGVDRIANVLGAMMHYSGSLIVIDLGSATTFDVAVAGVFVGGAILPGVRLQTQVLAARTALLPEVQLSEPTLALGKSTAEGLTSGIFWGHVGAVEKIVCKLSAELDDKATVVATGGLAHFFLGATNVIDHFIPYLTLEGIVEGFRRQRH